MGRVASECGPVPEGDGPPKMWARNYGLPIGGVTDVIALGQDPAPGRRHLSVAVANSPRPFSVAALEIERGAQYPSIVHLKGAVEITMPVCAVRGPGNTHTGAADVIVHADEAYLHEDTGQIDTGGAASITRK